jgi:uncharacterized protein
VRIVWDEFKRDINLARHGLDFADLYPDFFAKAYVAPSYEGRFVAIGRFRRSKVIAVVFVALGREAISVISMRPASRKERTIL